MTSITVGDPATFAIESGIAKAFEKPSQRAIGYFVIYVMGRCYGVKSLDATLLACSVDAVQERLERRRLHLGPFSAEPDPIKIVDAYLAARLQLGRESEMFFGMTATTLGDLFISSGLVWAPDGDEAFDDGSHVLQLDVRDKVRLIAFINSSNFAEVISTISEVWIDSDDYYDHLAEWLKRFEHERAILLRE
jgi:hypothetical protein